MCKKIEKIREDIKVTINEEEEKDIDIKELRKIRKSCDNLTDTRHDTSYHEIGDVVMLILIATFANCNEIGEIYEFGAAKEKWFKKFCKFKYGIPSESTIRRILTIIDTEELEEICDKKFEKLMKKIKEENASEEKRINAYDGKTINGSARNDTFEGKQKPVNAMTAYDATNEVCLKTKFIEKKTNEIPTMLDLLEYLDLKKTISTFDALNTQEKTIEKIVKKKGDYVAPVKGNHKLFYKELIEYFDDTSLYKKAKEKGYSEEVAKEHNQYEKREYILTDDIEWITEKEKWSKLKSIGICIRTCEDKQGKVTVEKRYYITSLSSENIKDFKRAVRGEWKIENNLHWQLDYTFKEDKSLIANRNAQQNLNIVRKFCLGTLKTIREIYPNKSLKKIRFMIGCDFENQMSKIAKFIEK